MHQTTFKVLSHACLLVKRKGVGLIIDPWLIGSCYWRSWWNYPEPDIHEEELQCVTHVLISHIHWDHWHGKSLKKYFKGREFLITDEPKTRSHDDLIRLRLGFVSRMYHGKTILLDEDFKVTVYQFGLFQNDSAIVIETPEVKLLNANDTKIAGLPLKQIIKRHQNFDFAFRSHSSANFRACIQVLDDKDQYRDDNEHYARSFKLFMDAVKPTYAVPFASNHCHLHQDTFHFNRIITNPIKLNEWLLHHDGLHVSQLKIMLPGSSWHSQHGFDLKDLSPFQDLEQKLLAYQQKNALILEDYYQLEANQTINASMMNKHETHLKAIPWLFRKMLGQSTFAYKIINHGNHHTFFHVDYIQCKLIEIDEHTYQQANINIECPVIVFKQAVTLNMYAHAFISKRVKFYVKQKKQFKSLTRYIGYLEKIEHEFFPLRYAFLKKFALDYCVRWREVVLYFLVLKEMLIQ